MRGSDLEDLQDRLLQVMDKYRETFFVVQLQPPGFVPGEIRDPDANIGCDLMDGRDQFLA